MRSDAGALQRGYAALRKENGEILRRASQARSGERAPARLARGELLCQVEEAEEVEETEREEASGAEEGFINPQPGS